MTKVIYYPLGLNTLNVAPNQIIMNGVLVARTFVGFVSWFKQNQLDVKQFKNWPFIEGISEPLPVSKFNSAPDVDKDELVEAMLKTNQFRRKEMQKAGERIRRRLKKPK